jgi:predicted metal-dependent enzyme (double-stranded beta helix superfamily)
LKWIHNIKYVFFLGSINKKSVQIWRDPVTIEPPIIVISSDEITMEMIANYKFAISANLTSECQKLYANVAGKEFILDTDDFPKFSEAIKRSINNPDGWCYKKLKEKSEEFGKKDEAATYLRITLGINQGDSPGVPYVMEIWPGGHYSPIHNHARANAIIRVLYGEIIVSLYSMLSLVEIHQKPFSEQRLKQGEITWIAPELNQTHKLYNPNGKDSPCITIQCYLYNEKDNSHYEYFDYINNDGTEICQFDPVSDMDFLEFKKLMKEEWHNLHNI